MKYLVKVIESEESFTVCVPGLPGCWSEGDTEPKALENIKDAIREYLAAVKDESEGAKTREVEVAV